MNFVLEKYHVLGNDYLMYDPEKNETELTRKMIKAICHRNFGVGADGVLVGPVFTEDGIYVSIYNPDGSEAENSGSGICIFAKYLKDAGYIQKNHLKFHTRSGEVEAVYQNEEGSRLKISMGRLSFWSDDIPMTGERREVVEEELDLNGTQYLATCVSIGNPHCIIPMHDISKGMVCHIGPFCENAECFPNRVNTQLLEVVDRNNIKIEIYERGAGYTLAAGTNACAAAGAAYRMGLTDDKMFVHMPGGVLEVEISEDWRAFMTGEVFHIGKITLSHAFSEKLRSI